MNRANFLKTVRQATFISILLLGSTVSLALLQATAEELPYDKQLLRVAELLGSVHYLRGLCGEQEGHWRSQMEALLEAENPDPERRARFIGSFNYGYNSYATSYTSCTESALAAIERYNQEGEKLLLDIIQRYGN